MVRPINKQWIDLLSLLLIATVVFFSFSSPATKFAISNLSEPTKQVINQATINCQNQKLSQAKTVRFCPYSTPKPYIAQSIFAFTNTANKTLFFLFIISLFTTHILQRIYKPPKFICCCR